MHFHPVRRHQVRLHNEQDQPRHEQQRVEVHGCVRNAAGDGCRMPGDQAEKVRPREADQSREQHRDRHAGVELSVGGRERGERTGRSSRSHNG